MKLKAKLSEYEMSIDPVFLAKLIRVNLFSKYLSTYAEYVEYISNIVIGS